MPNPLIHFAGAYAQSQIHTDWADDPPPAPAAVETVIEAEWASAIARPGIHLFDGPMLRLNTWHADHELIRLNFGRTSYKRFWGTNLHHPELADQYTPDVLANPLGLSAAVQSADGYLLLGRRNACVAYYPNRIHPFAGTAESTGLFSEILRELNEELTLTPADIATVKCIGMVEDTTIRQPEIIFSVLSNLTLPDIERRLDRNEHTAIFAVPCNDDVLHQTIANTRLTPVAVGALKLWLH